MIGRSKLWRVAAVSFTLLNVGGVVYGVLEDDMMHAVGHMALQLVGFVVWRLTATLREDHLPVQPQIDERRIEYLQQSVDAIALEVERLGEKQRFSEKLRSQAGETPEGGR
ncbi:MAG TPA: hypothetical protein VFS56_11015 [Gemmatimonadaceae bacterium]|nr:hypothetical protein [Gemmatimonadaceae bacterium]